MRLALVLIASVLAGGCTHVRPWERGKLAHPTMNGVGESGLAQDHVYAVHEGATGGSAAAESGCGCN